MIDEIHHYCSPSVFLSLIKNKELWLTSLSQSNDKLEGTWMLHHWLERFRADPSKRLLRRGAQFAIERVLRENVALGVCFSEDRDLLSQWRGYAQDGAGFSVTFDSEKLQRLARDSGGGSPLALAKISYGYQDVVEVNEIARKLFSAFGEDAEKYHEGPDGYGTMSLSFTPEKRQQQKEVVRNLFTVKNGAFKEEREWRLFFYGSIDEIDNVEFRESRNILSPFVRLKVPANAIVGVTLGPTNRTSQTMVEAVLKTYEIKSWVRVSNASYRNN